MAVGLWSIAGAGITQIDATLRTLQGNYECLVSGRHLGNPDGCSASKPGTTEPFKHRHARWMVGLAGAGRTRGCHRLGLQTTALTQQRQLAKAACPRSVPEHVSHAVRRVRRMGQ